MSAPASTPAGPPPIGAGRFLVNVVVKAALLFVVIDLLVAVIDPLPVLSRLTAYNTLLPGTCACRTVTRRIKITT